MKRSGCAKENSKAYEDSSSGKVSRQHAAKTEVNVRPGGFTMIPVLGRISTVGVKKTIDKDSPFYGNS